MNFYAGIIQSLANSSPSLLQGPRGQLLWAVTVSPPDKAWVYPFVPILPPPLLPKSRSGHHSGLRNSFLATVVPYQVDYHSGSDSSVSCFLVHRLPGRRGSTPGPQSRWADGETCQAPPLVARSIVSRGPLGTQQGCSLGRPTAGGGGRGGSVICFY